MNPYERRASDIKVPGPYKEGDPVQNPREAEDKVKERRENISNINAQVVENFALSAPGPKAEVDNGSPEADKKAPPPAASKAPPPAATMDKTNLGYVDVVNNDGEVVGQAPIGWSPMIQNKSGWKSGHKLTVDQMENAAAARHKNAILADGNHPIHKWSEFYKDQVPGLTLSHPIPACAYDQAGDCMPWWDKRLADLPARYNLNKMTTVEGHKVTTSRASAYNRVFDNFRDVTNFGIGKDRKHLAPHKDYCESLGWYVTCMRHNHAGKWLDGGYTRVDSTDVEVVHKDPTNDYDGGFRKRSKDELLGTFKNKYCKNTNTLEPCEFRFLEENYPNGAFDTQAGRDAFCS